MKIGLDIVHIERIKSLMADKNALANVFNPGESSDDPWRLAGWFAAKEAYFKALGKKGDWLELAVGHDDNGAPYLLVRGQRDERVRLSISHDGEYAAALALIDDAVIIT